MQYLVSGIEMAEMDRRTIESLELPGRVLMEIAGRGAARLCERYLDGPSRVVIACGGGNNGGDGYVIARALVAAGHSVRVYLFAAANKIKGDAKGALSTLRTADDAEIIEAAVVNDARALAAFSAEVEASDLAVDALLGTGLHEDVRGQIAAAIDVLNSAATKVVAVDLPSGIDADTGAVLGSAVEAVATATFAFAKRGHYLFPGAEYRGHLEVIDIGVPQRFAVELGVLGRRLSPADGPSMLPMRHSTAHKGNFGHAVIFAGKAGAPGAALLALAGALRAGAGLVSWAVDDSTLKAAREVPPEVMLRRPTPGSETTIWISGALEGATAVVLGPGVGKSPDALSTVATVLSRARCPLCLDADALNILADVEELWNSIQVPVVITPHPKEMARLMGSSVEDVQRDRFAAALELAASRKCVVVLKGAGTVIAEPDGVVAVLDAGNPGMATGGAGDVLAGVIGALLAQGLDVADAARIGALLHSAAGDLAAERVGQAGLTAGDIADALGGVWRQWNR